MASGTISGPKTGNHGNFWLELDWRQMSSNADNLTSQLRLNVRLRSIPGGALNLTQPKSGWTKAGSEVRHWSIPPIWDETGDINKIVDSQTFTVSHNSDGTASIVVGARYNVDFWFISESRQVEYLATGDRTITLDPIDVMEAPNAPTNVSLSVSGTSLSTTWSHSATTRRPVSRFRVERSVDGAAYTAVTTTTSTSNSGSGSRGSSYRYRVRAENDAGNSAWANSATESIPYLAPHTPTLSSSQSGTGVPLTWTITTHADRPITRFRIQRRLSGGTFEDLATQGSAVRAYTNTGLTRGNTYQYRIRAEGDGGESSYSNTVTERVPFLAPNKPASVSVERSSHARFVLSWAQTVTSDRPVDSFEIFRSVNGSSFSRLTSVNGSTRSYNDNSVELGKTYQYYLVAINVDHSTTSDNSNSLTNPAGLPVYNGTAFHIRPVYVFDGTEWHHRSVYVNNGTSWHWRG